MPQMGFMFTQGKVNVHVDDLLWVTGSEPTIERNFHSLLSEGSNCILGPHERDD